MTPVGSRRISVDDFPLLSKEESKMVLELYNDECLEKGCRQYVISYDELPEHPVDVYSLKIKKEA